MSDFWRSDVDSTATSLTLSDLDALMQKCFDDAGRGPTQFIVSPGMKLQIEAADRRYRRWDQRAKRKLTALKWRIYWAGPWGARRKRRRDALWRAKELHPGYKEYWPYD